MAELVQTRSAHLKRLDQLVFELGGRQTTSDSALIIINYVANRRRSRALFDVSSRLLRRALPNARALELSYTP